MRRRFRRGIFVVPSLAVLLGSGFVASGVLFGTEPSLTSMAEIESLYDCREFTVRKQRRKCFESNAGAHIELVRKQLQQLPADVQPVVRDHLRVRAAAQQPWLAVSLCDETETAEGARLCSRLAHRPHLYVTSEEWTQRESGLDSKRSQRGMERRSGSGANGRGRGRKNKKKRGSGG